MMVTMITTVAMMDDNDDVKAGREFHTDKDIGVKSQMEGVKRLLVAPPSPFFLPTLENDKQAYPKR